MNRTREELIRRYILGTLSQAERENVERQLQHDPEWKELLEREQSRLKSLDVLPDHDVPTDLADRTLRKIRLETTRSSEPASHPVRRALVTAISGIVLCGVIAAILLPALSRSREAARRSSCENNLKQWALVFKMYANESKGELYPPLAKYNGIWVPDLRVLYPEYLTDPSILVCPNSNQNEFDELREALEQDPPDWETAHRILGHYVLYTGYTLPFQESYENFELAYQQMAQRFPDEDLEGPEGRIFRLREGVERFLITDINNPGVTAKTQGLVPILIENVFDETLGHRKGANVLYLDGHIEFKPYDEDDPFWKSIREALNLPDQKK